MAPARLATMLGVMLTSFDIIAWNISGSFNCNGAASAPFSRTFSGICAKSGYFLALSAQFSGFSGKSSRFCNVLAESDVPNVSRFMRPSVIVVPGLAVHPGRLDLALPSFDILLICHAVTFSRSGSGSCSSRYADNCAARSSVGS